MFADNNQLYEAGDPYLGASLTQIWRKRKKVIIGAAVGLTAVAAGAYYFKNVRGTKKAGDTLAKKSGAAIPQTKAQSKSLWDKAKGWFSKSGVAKGAADAAIGEIIAGKRPMPAGLQQELKTEPKKGIGAGAAVLGAGAVVAAVAINK